MQVFGSLGFGLFGFTKFGQNTKTLKLAEVGQHIKTLKLAKSVWPKSVKPTIGQSRSSPQLAKVGHRAGQSRFGQSRP